MFALFAVRLLLFWCELDVTVAAAEIGVFGGLRVVGWLRMAGWREIRSSSQLVVCCHFL